MESAPSNPDTRPLPAGWHQHYDFERHTWYYVQINVLPPKVSYTHPASLSETPPRRPTAAPVPPIDPTAEIAPSLHKNRAASSPRLSPAQLLYANAISKRKTVAGSQQPPSEGTSINVGSDSESLEPSSEQPPLSSSTSQSSFFQSSDDPRPTVQAESSNKNVISPRVGSKRRSKLSTGHFPTVNTLRSVPDTEPAEKLHNAEVLDPLPLDQMNKFNKVKITKPTRPGEAPTILMTAIPPEQERSSRDAFTLPQPHVNTSSSTQRSGPSHDAHLSPSSSRPLPQPKPTTIHQQQEQRHIQRPQGSVSAAATSNVHQPLSTLPRTPTQAWDLSDDPNVPRHAAYPAVPTQQQQQQTHHNHGSGTNQSQPARSSNVNTTQTIDRPSHQTSQSLARLPMSLERPFQDQIPASGLQQSGSQNRPLPHSLPRQENVLIPTRSSSLDLASAYQQPPSQRMLRHGQSSTVTQRRSSIQRSHSYQATHRGDQVDMGEWLRQQQQQYSHDHRQAMVTATAQGHSQPQQPSQQHSAPYDYSSPDAQHDLPLVEQVTVGPFHAMQYGDFNNQDYIRRPGIGRRGFAPP